MSLTLETAMTSFPKTTVVKYVYHVDFGGFTLIAVLRLNNHEWIVLKGSSYFICPVLSSDKVPCQSQ